VSSADVIVRFFATEWLCGCVLLLLCGCVLLLLLLLLLLCCCAAAADCNQS
jgi:hypothetical protein